MMSVEQCSRKFDFLRLHRWAWDKKLIRKPRSMDESSRLRHIKELLQALVGSMMKRKGLPYTIQIQGETIQVHSPELATWLDLVLPEQTQFPSLKLTPPTEQTPWFELPCLQGYVSCAAEKYLEFENDIQLLEQLAQKNFQETGLETPFGQSAPRRGKTKKKSAKTPEDTAPNTIETGDVLGVN